MSGQIRLMGLEKKQVDIDNCLSAKRSFKIQENKTKK